MSLVDSIHSGYVHHRRTQVLSRHLANVIPINFRMLDVGSGDGLIGRLISQSRPDITITGIDVMVRDPTHIPTQKYNGKTIPFEDASFDGVMFVDVLHHTSDPMILLREAARVAREAIIIKDHTKEGFFAGLTLRFMDKVGNERHGVSLPYNYWTKSQWLQAFDILGLHIGDWTTNLRLYPLPASWVFDRSLHFITRLIPV